MTVLVYAAHDPRAAEVRAALAEDLEFSLAVGVHVPDLRVAQAPAVLVWGAAAAEVADSLYALMSRARAFVVVVLDATPWRGPTPLAELAWSGPSCAYRARAALARPAIEEARCSLWAGWRRSLAGILAIAGLAAPVVVASQPTLAPEPSARTASTQAGHLAAPATAEMISVAETQGVETAAASKAASIPTLLLSKEAELASSTSAVARATALVAAFSKDPALSPPIELPRACTQANLLMIPLQAMS